MKPQPTAFLVTLAALALCACAPVFSELSGARLVAPHKTELTPSASAVYFSDSGDRDHLQDHFGLQVAGGVTERLELRGRYENIRLVDDRSGGSVNVLGFGPKLRLKRDRLAFYLPVGFGFGGDVDTSQTWSAHPTLIFTQPAGANLDVNVSTKYIYWFSGESDDLVAFNLGLGIGPRSRRWTIRPEVGLLVDPGESGRYVQTSLGFSVKP